MPAWKFSTNSILLNSNPALVFHVFSLQQTSAEDISWQFDLFIKSCVSSFNYTSIIFTHQQSLLIVGNYVFADEVVRKFSKDMKAKVLQIANEYLPSNFNFKPVSGYKVKHDFPHFSYIFTENSDKQLIANNEIYEFYEFKKLRVVGNHHSVLIKALSASSIISLHFAFSQTSSHVLIQFRGTAQQILHEKNKLMKTLHDYPNITGELKQVTHKFVINNPGRCLFGLTKASVSSIELYKLLHNGPVRYNAKIKHLPSRTIHKPLARSTTVPTTTTAPTSITVPTTTGNLLQKVSPSVSLENSISNPQSNDTYLLLKNHLNKYGWKELRYLSKYGLVAFHLGELTAKIYLSKENALQYFSPTREFLPASYLFFISNDEAEIVLENHTISPLFLNIME